MSKIFSWLHLSDLHIGQKGTHLWPNFRAKFFEDVRLHVKEYGPLDLVIFSGDLTQKATQEEFSELKSELEKLWAVFQEIGCKPYLFCVPGNHDLSRPSEKNAQVKLLKNWETDHDVIPELLADAENQYAKVVHGSFANYVAWLSSPGAPLAPRLKSGILPGDCSATLIVDGLKIGLVGLNSAYLQLSNGDYLNHLLVDPRQLSAVTDDDAPTWCSQHNFNFLVTHHPTAWLQENAGQSFMREIHMPNRFVAHLFGHMHKPASERKSTNGGGERREVQASSLFGMEHWGENGTEERIHGFSFNQITIDESAAIWRTWPRQGVRTSDDAYISPDHAHFQLLRNTEYFDTPIPGLKLPPIEEMAVVQVAPPAPAALGAEVKENSGAKLDMADLGENDNANFALSRCIYNLEPAEQHLAIRIDDRKKCAAEITRSKMVWLGADIETGRDGFIWSTLKELDREKDPVYRIRLGEFRDKKEFQDRFLEKNNCAFADFCGSLDKLGPSVLLLEDAPTTTTDIAGFHVEAIVESLLEIARLYLPNTAMVLISRSLPRNSNIKSWRLSSLPEPETFAYLQAQRHRIENEISVEFVDKVQRISQGLTIRIDDLIINQLKVLPIDAIEPPELSETSTESASSIVSPALIKIIEDLESSEDPLNQRAYLLLQILAFLPHGESSRELKNIDSTKPLFAKHAGLLSKLDLVEGRISQNLIGQQEQADQESKAMVMQPHVRDFVLFKLDGKKKTQLIQQLANHYFGNSWLTGNLKPAKISQIVSLAIGGVAGNPHSLILRMLNDGSMKTRPTFAAAVLKVCVAYSAALRAEAQYRQAMSFSTEMLQLIPLESTRERIAIELKMAQAIRMAGDAPRALPLFEKLLSQSISNDERRSALVGKALCLEKLGDAAAVDVCRIIQKNYPKTATAMQAKVIILEYENPEDKASQRYQLEKKSRKDGHIRVANQLALRRVISHTYPNAISVLREVYESAIEPKNIDPYISHQAATRIADYSFRLNETVAHTDLQHVVEAYHYFYGERFDVVFTYAHRTLWDYFDFIGQLENMLALYRHSSFVWLLNGQIEHEQHYLSMLEERRSEILALGRPDDKNISYFLNRSVTQLNADSEQTRGVGT